MEQTLSTVDKLYAQLQRFDYVKLGEKIILALITVYAVIVGVSLYAYTAFQLWWLDNGEIVTNNIKTNTNRIVDYFFYHSTNQ